MINIIITSLSVSLLYQKAGKKSSKNMPKHIAGSLCNLTIAKGRPIVYNKDSEREVHKMKKFNVPVISYEFDAKHSGAHYKVENGYCNSGEFIERCVKTYFNEPATKDSIPYWAGSDIESTKASLKSFGASLATGMKSTESKSEIIEEYLGNVHSERFYFGALVNETVIVYDMNKAEFTEMLENLWKLNDKRLRLKTCDTKVIKWCEDRTA